jgi:hypothetical protein
MEASGEAHASTHCSSGLDEMVRGRFVMQLIKHVIVVVAEQLDFFGFLTLLINV